MSICATRLAAKDRLQSTNSKLFPNALSFGPAMPGVEYTGHTENEFITYKQFMLNLKMYTAAFVELAK